MKHLFLLTIALLGFLLKSSNECKRTGKTAARSNTDEIVASGQIVQGIGNKVAIRCRRHANTLPKEVLHLDPKPVLQQIRIRDHNHVYGFSRFHEVCVFGRFWFGGILVILFFRRRVSFGECGLDCSCDPCGHGELFSLGTIGTQQTFHIRHKLDPTCVNLHRLLV